MTILGIGIGIGYQRGGGFSPAALFAGGEAGAWYDPSDLTTLFQDSAGTTPVTTAGDPVGRMLDKSGRGNHATQATPGSRPTYQTELTRGLTLAPDYWVDAVNGNDANAGTSLALAWKTLSMINTITVVNSQTVTVRVRKGTYSSATDNALLHLGVQSGVTARIVFEPGCVIDGTAYTLGTQNGVSFRTDNIAGVSNKFYAYGNGCTIQNVTTADGNGLDGSGYGTAHFYDFNITNCRDGISMHEQFEGNFYGVTVTDCLKWTLAHVGTCLTRHYNCSFSDANSTATLGGLCAMQAVNTHYFENCVFLPGATTYASRLLDCTGGSTTFQNCRLGTLARRVELVPFGTGTATVQDSFVNAFWDGVYADATLTRCFGLFSARTGNNGGPLTVTNCVFSGPASTYSSIFFSGYDPGSSSTFTVRDNIFETASASAFMDVDATNAGYLVAAASRFRNNILSGSAAVDADLIAADSGGVVVGSNITADALIGAANTLDPDDYGYTSGSPAIGAGTGGTNSGFAVGAVAETVLVDQARPLRHFLQFDGSDDGLVTSTITPGTNKVQVFAGVQKDNDVTGFQTVVEHSDDLSANTGTLAIFAPGNPGPGYQVRSKGTTEIQASVGTGYPAPIGNVLTLTADISAPIIDLRVDGASVASASSSQGTGNYLAYPMYIGRRGGGGGILPFDGNLYALVVRFGATLTTAQVEATEDFVGSKMGVAV